MRSEIQPLVPALQSWWMKIHVPANFIGYGTLRALSRPDWSLRVARATCWLAAKAAALACLAPASALPHRGCEVLDDVMYKSIAVGFAFFTIATDARRAVGGRSLGRLLELGPEGNLGADRLAELRGLAAHAPDEGPARRGRPHGGR